MRKLLFLAALFVTAATAQTFDASRIGEPVKLKGNWRFHAGDNPAWAQPDFDDSGWRSLDTDTDWDRQGLPKVRGYVWLRAKVKLPSDSGKLELLVTDFGPLEVYVDGRRAGSFGRFPPNASIVQPNPQIFPLRAHGSEVSLAVRYWLSPVLFSFGKLGGDIVVGTNGEIDRRRQAWVNSAVAQESPDYVIAALIGVLFPGLLVLFWLQRERTEYLFLSLALVATVVRTLLQDIGSLIPIRLDLTDYIADTSQAAAAICMIEFVFRFLNQRVPKWLRVYQVSMAFIWVPIWMGWSGMASVPFLNVFFLLYFTPYWFLLPGILFFQLARGNREAGLLAIPLSLLTVDAIISTLAWVLFQLHLRSSFKPFIQDLHLGIVTVGPGTIFFLLFLLCIAALILIRFQKTRVAEARANAELEAARHMQEVMVPKAVAASGFEIETAYIPAQEVGGDFFQLFPGDDGSLLVVIGDVSGKGLKAAMLVSMIVGLLRRAVTSSRSPAQILRELNALLIGHTDEKFATCCCALLNPDGSMLAANAGHLSPYCDGKELELPGGLPLGVAADAAYEEVYMQTGARSRLVFLSDGVIEARAKSGELYGFERTRIISIQAVRDIAESAQRFGQEDDITVLGIAPLAPARG